MAQQGKIPLKLKQPSNFDCMIETFEKTLHSRPIGLMGGIEQELRHFRNINGLAFESMFVYRACDKEGNEVYDCRLDKRRKKNERREGETDRLTASYSSWFEDMPVIMITASDRDLRTAINK